MTTGVPGDQLVGASSLEDTMLHGSSVPSRLLVGAILVLVVSVTGCGGSETRTDTNAGSAPGGAASDAAPADVTDDAKADAAAIAVAAEKEISEGESVAWAFGSLAGDVEATPIAVVVADPDAYKGKPLVVSGKVAAVCQNSGCWVDIEAEDGSKIRAMSPEHDVLLPKNCVGLPITVQGVIPPDSEEGSLSMTGVVLRRSEG